ncbi:hypothetical protein KC342_g6 [Hortaea werneckii]|nr:hypothetical protein KC342_g6 [Hortaea werneckii]
MPGYHVSLTVHLFRSLKVPGSNPGEVNFFLRFCVLRNEGCSRTFNSCVRCKPRRGTLHHLPFIPSEAPDLILKLHPTLLPHRPINPRNIPLIPGMRNHVLEMLIRDLQPFHLRPTVLGQIPRMSRILPRQLGIEQGFLPVIVIPRPQTVRDVAFGQRLDHGEDEGVPDDFQPGGGALWLPGVVDLCPAHDPLAEGFHAGDFVGGSGEDADEVPGVRHRGRPEYGTGDEGGAGGVDGLGELVRGVRVHGGAVDEEFAFGCGGVLEGGEDDVGLLDGFGDRACRRGRSFGCRCLWGR